MLGKLTEKEIESLLLENSVGRVGCYADNRIYIVPITYAYKDGFVYAHSAEGRKLKMMRKNPSVCFQVDTIAKLSQWKSIIAWGTFEEITSEEGRQLALTTLLEKVVHQSPSETMRPAHRLPEPHPHQKSHKAIAFRIFLKEKTGRFERQF